MPVVVLGDLCPDLVVRGVPTDGRSLTFGQAEELVAETTATLGGSGALTACAARAAGAEVALAAVVGDDPFGDLSLAMVRERGVDVTAVRVDPAVSTGSSVVLVRADDPTDRETLTHLGTLGELTEADCEAGLDRYDGEGQQRMVHVSSFFLHHHVRHRLAALLERRRAAGWVVSLDTNDDPDREWTAARDVVATADIVFGNDDELESIAAILDPPSGIPEEDSATGHGAAERILAAMPTHPYDARLPAVVHKLGAGGAAVVTRGRTVSCAAPIVPVTDTIGAGDTLAGVVLAALASGTGWPEAIAEGVAAGSLSVSTAGGASDRVTRTSITELARTLATTARTQEDPS